MDQLIERFPAQLAEALEIGSTIKISTKAEDIDKIYVAGLGGSGIGANIVGEFISQECPIPYLVGKGYDIPKYVDKKTLAVLSSYSGNTEETLSAYEKIKESGAKIFIISSGGKLIKLAEENGYDYVKVPGDWPSPRACLGFSLVQQMCMVNKLGLIPDDKIKELKSSIDLVKFNMDDIKVKAEKIAELIFGKIPVIYTTNRMESVAVRFRQQINENAKMLCWHHVIPEMNHNELVGWRDKNDNLAVIYFRNRDDFKRNSIRIDINKEIIGECTNTIIEIYSKGQTTIEKSMYFIHLGDWISWYLSVLHRVDSIEVKVIDYLKAELAKV